MNKYLFHGLIIPERANVYITRTNCFCQDKKIEINIECNYSKVIAECSCNDSEINLLTLKNIVENVVRNIVDSLGYTTACGYDVGIESAYNLNTKDWDIFGVHEDIFDDAEINANTAKGMPHPEILISTHDLAKISGVNIELQIALSDFREAIRQPNFTSFHCYRAIEALKQIFDGDDKAQWEELRSNLQIDREEILIIQNGAVQLRHGKATPQPWADRKQHMLITWRIIKKYIDWLMINKSF